MTLSTHVRTLGRGPGRSRSLTRDEAREAMALMLSPDTAPEAVGAVLMLLRMKGETAGEIAGFTEAVQDAVQPLPPVDLDWPSYAAGRTRGLPWFLLSARLVAGAGHRVLLHGWNGSDGAVRGGLDAAGVPVAHTLDDLPGLLDRNRIAYLPLETLCPDLFRLLSLRGVLGLRSCVNTVCRMANPARAPASVQGVFHPPYRAIQSEAAAMLGWPSMSVIKGGGGEFERHPSKSVSVFGLRAGALWESPAAPLDEDTRRLDDGARDPAALAALWRGELRDPFIEKVVLGTAALALDTLGIADPDQAALRLWFGRTPEIVG